MRWYRCFIRGENFPRRRDPGKDIVLFSFYTTRWVQAKSAEEAEVEGLALLRSEATFVLPEGYSGPVNARVYFEEIDEATGPQTQGGATWFEMDGNESET